MAAQFLQQGHAGQHRPVQSQSSTPRPERGPDAQRRLLRGKPNSRQTGVQGRRRRQHADRPGAQRRAEHHDHGQQGRCRPGQERAAGARPAAHARAVLLAGAEPDRPALSGRPRAPGLRRTRSTARRSSRRSRRATAARQLGHRAGLQGLLRPVARIAVPVQRRQGQAAAGRSRLDAWARTASCRKTASRSSSPWTSASAACCSRPTS